MMLEQIEAKQQAQIAFRNALQDPKTPGKTIGVKVPILCYDRLAVLKDSKDPKRDTMKKLALEAMILGLDAIEQRYAASQGSKGTVPRLVRHPRYADNA